MTERVKSLLKTLQDKKYQTLRDEKDLDITSIAAGKTDMHIAAVCLKTMLENEHPMLFKNDRIGFNRTDRKSTRLNSSH